MVLTNRGSRACAAAQEVLDAMAFCNPSSRRRVQQLVGAECCIAAGLEMSASREDWDEFQSYVIAAGLHPHASMTRSLCDALDRQFDQVNNDDIVTALDRIADPAAIGALERATWWEPDWDEYRHLAIKCVWALSVIDSKGAREALKDAFSVGPARVRYAAAQALGISIPYPDGEA